MNGNVDKLENGILHGWIKKTDHDGSLSIDCLVNGVLVAQNHLANLLREDLDAAGVGNGEYGFAIPVLDAGAEPSEVDVMIRVAGEMEIALAATFEFSPPSGPYRGNIDEIINGTLFGWIRHSDHEDPLAIECHVDGNVICTGILANHYRKDLKAAGEGHGQYGFIIPLLEAGVAPSEIDIAIRIAGETEVLLSDRLTLTLPVPEYLGRIEVLTPTQIKGWCVDKLAPGDIFDIDVMIDGELFTTIKNDTPRGDLKAKEMSKGLGGILADLPLAWLEKGEHIVSLLLPDGKAVEQPIIIGETRRRIPSPSCSALMPRRLSIVVPIFNAVEDVQMCIERLTAHTPPDVDILLIDDGSTDPRIGEILANASGHESIRVLHCPTNLGFTRTVNRGLIETGRNDVIILNSDARVTPGWIEGMTFAARSEPRIATVTAMSDRAGAFSAPRIGNNNPLPDGVDEITYARVFRRHSIGFYPVVPTGNGFCMYISRACLDEVGLLDAEAFPRGYGEENDFCMRAGRAGWRNIIDDRTYVFHSRSKSFGDEKIELMEAGRQIVDARYPEYKKAIGVFSNGERIRIARFRAQQALAACTNAPRVATRILFVTSTQSGGTPQTNGDLMQGLSTAIDSWVLRCDSKVIELSQIIRGETRIYRTQQLDEPVDPISHRSTEYEAVISAWLLELDADIVHIRHLGWHSLTLPKIAKALGAKVIFSFHDFYALCPTVKLLDENNKFCGGKCTASAGSCSAQLWPEGSLPELKHSWVHLWRERFAEALEACDAFITTSNSARQRILEALPSLPGNCFKVIPHGRDFQRFHRLRQPAAHGKPLRILVPGNIDAAKGLDIIDALIEYDKAGLLEFHVIGEMPDRDRAISPRLIRHGKYVRDNFYSKAEPIRAHLGAIFSVWDETYCHTLTELWSIGLPVMVFNFPTVATRVRESGAGWVMDHADIPALYEQILRVAFNPKEQQAKDNAVAEWQSRAGVGNTIRVMAASYLDVYRDVMRGEKAAAGEAMARFAVVCPAEDNLESASASTAIRVWERTRNLISRDVNYIRMSPETLLANLSEGTLDGAIIQRTAIPSTLAPTILNAFSATRTPYLFDIDDDLLNVPDDKDPAGVYAAYAPVLRMLLENASILTVSTEPLLEAFRSINPNVVLLPNRLSNRLWGAEPADPIFDGTVRALYMATKTHLDDLNMILPALDLVAAACPEFRLTLIGVLPSEPLIADRQEWLEYVKIPAGAKSYDGFVPWLRKQARLFDFGIAPLAESPFNACKSSLKILDYAALGLPSLVSDIEVYRNLANLAPSGVRLVGNTVEDWTAALMEKVALGIENRHIDLELRRWVIETQMLDETLADFDTMLRSMVAREPKIKALTKRRSSAGMT